MNNDLARPERTHALVVGIERYVASPDWNLNGPAGDARSFSEYLRTRGVKPTQIHLFLSPLEKNQALVDCAEPEAKPATMEAVSAAVRTLHKKQGDLLVIYWGGHGIANLKGNRRLFFANADEDDKLNLDLNSLLESLGTTYFSGFRRQLVFIDACANFEEDMQWAFHTPGITFSLGDPLDTRQFVFFAARLSETARNLESEGTGFFSKTLLDNLKQQPASHWPPELGSITREIRREFDALRATGQATQMPVYYSKDWDGNVKEHNSLLQMRTVPFQAQPLGMGFVPRPTDVKAVKQLLTGNDRLNGLRIVGVTGLGGSGKSTLAAAVVRDSEIFPERFPDGILWATLGHRPNVSALLGGWIQELGDYDYSFTEAQVGQRHLHSLLKKKSVLLVLDDAWDADVVRSMVAGGPRCAVLITTRESVVVKAAGARVEDLHELGMMTMEQSLALLAGGADKALPDAVLDAATDVVEELGRHPLALKLASTQVSEGVGWSDLLSDLRTEIAQIESLDDPGVVDIDDFDTRKQLSLVSSLNLSLRRLSPPQQRFFAWLGVLPDDVTLTPAMAATLWNVNERTARDTLRSLRAKALLVFGAPRADGTPTLQVHDILHDLARALLSASVETDAKHRLPGLGISLKQGHIELLDRYRERIENGPWHTLPDDGYIHDHLIWHLEQADRTEEIHDLLCEETPDGRNGWYEAREAQQQFAGYITDIATAWHLADPKKTRGQEVVSARRIFYALVVASLNSFAKNLPPPLLVALVEKDVLTVPQAMAYARRNSTLHQIQVLAVLAPELEKEEQIKSVNEALAGVRLIDDETERGTALAQLAPQLAAIDPFMAVTQVRSLVSGNAMVTAYAALIPHLPEELRAEVLHEAVEAAVRVGEVFRAGSLNYLVPFLTEPILRDVRERLRAMKHRYHYEQCLRMLTGRLAELGMLDDARAVADSIQDQVLRATSIASIVPYLSEPERSASLRAVLDAVRSVDDESWRNNQREHLSLSAGEPLVTIIMATLVHRSWRTNVLDLVAEYLSEPMREQALDIVLTATDGAFQAMGFAVLARYISESLRDEKLPAVLASAHKIEFEVNRLPALIALAEFAVDRRSLCLKILEQLPRAVALNRQELWCSLMSILPEDLFADALAAVSDRSTDTENRTLGAIAPFLPKELLSRTLDKTRAIGDSGLVGIALASLARYLSEREMRQALEAIEQSEPEYRRAEALALIAPSLPPVLLEQALVITRDLGHPSNRAETALAALAPCFQEPRRTEILREAVEVAIAMDSLERMAWAFDTLGSLGLPDSLILETLQNLEVRINEKGDSVSEYGCALARASLLPFLPEDRRNDVAAKVVEGARKVEKDTLCSRILTAMAPHWSKEALTLTLGMEPYRRAMTLAKVVPHMHGDVATNLVWMAVGALNEISDPLERDRILGMLIPSMADPEFGIEVPGQPTGLNLGLVLARGVGDEWYRSWALIGLAPKITPQIFDQAVDVARDIDSKDHRAEALLALYSKVSWVPPDSILKECFNSAIEIESDDTRTKVLAALAEPLRKLSTEQLGQLWRKASDNMLTRTRVGLCLDISALAPVMSFLHGEILVKGTFDSLQDVSKWWP